MEQVIFTCLTSDMACEWFHLKDFVRAFNDIHGTSYSLSKCLDVYGMDNKQPAQAVKRPEVLLESDGEAPIVIERKAVVWPDDYLRYHSKEHLLYDRVANLPGAGFNDSTYELTFHADDLKGKLKSNVKGIARQIVEEVVSNFDMAKSARGIGGRTPRRWGFRPLAPYEIDGLHPTHGIRADVRLAEFNHSRETELEGFAERFCREANKAGKKYDEYPNCLKLLVVQFVGEGSSLMDEDIIEIIKTARIPNEIDQVWLTGREWTSLDDYELAWERVR